MNRIYFVAALFIVTLLSGCGTSWFADPKMNPVIEDKVGANGKEVLGTLATTADRRTVLVKLISSGDANDIGKFCAEPSPDVAENIVSKLTLLIEAEAKATPPAVGTGATGKGKINLDKLLNTTIQALGKRSQGLQLYRDGMYNYCQAYLNGAISTPAEFQTKTSALLETAAKLIAIQLELTGGNMPTSSTAGTPADVNNKK